MSQKPIVRMTFHQLLTLSEKSTRDLAEHVQTILLAQLAECRDLSRPVRRRSHYPTMRAIGNALKKLQRIGDETQLMIDDLGKYLQAIKERAKLPGQPS